MPRTVWADLARRGKPSLWLIAIVTSVVLLGFVVFLVDWPLALEMLRLLSPQLLCGAILIFMLEGVCTAMRFQALLGRDVSRYGCFRMSAHYVVVLILLPARLGELAGVLLLKREFGQNSGAAASNIFVQRLIDVIVLVGVFLATLFVNVEIGGSGAYLIALVIFSLCVLCLLHLDKLIAIAVMPFLAIAGSRPTSMRRRMRRLLLQARGWCRRTMQPAILSRVVALSIAKWGCNLLGLALLFTAVTPDLHTSSRILLGVLYNFLNVVPLQTVGGIGIGEAGLTGLFVLVGISVSVAASASLIVRIALIATPFLFWLLVAGSRPMFRPAFGRGA
jgi:uncharacterized protein (TIRG00374 family)